MLSHVLTAISLALEGAGIAWAGQPFNGSSAERQVTWQPTDPDAPRLDGLMVGLEWMFNPAPSLLTPLFGVQTVIVTNPLTGAAVLERPLERESRLCRVHLYLRETRRPADRTAATKLSTGFQECEKRILNTLSRSRRDWKVLIEGIERGFSSEYVPATYPASSGLELHGVYTYRLHYPILDASKVEGAFVPTRINLIAREPVSPPRDLSNTPEPVTVPPPGRVITLERL